MQDIAVTLIAFAAAGLIVRGWFKRRRAAAPKCANCVVATEFEKVQAAKGPKVQGS